MAPQRLEKIESAPENGMASAASDPQDMVAKRGGRRGKSAEPAGVKEGTDFHT